MEPESTPPLVAPAVAPSAPADDELRQLRVELRDRHSIDHLARAWTSVLVFILLVGVWVKLSHDSKGHPLFLWPAALLCVAVFCHAGREAWRGFRMLEADRARLRRLRDLEARVPAARELF